MKPPREKTEEQGSLGAMGQNGQFSRRQLAAMRAQMGSHPYAGGGKGGGGFGKGGGKGKGGGGWDGGGWNGGGWNGGGGGGGKGGGGKGGKGGGQVELCGDWSKGNCNRGSYCRYMHT